VTAFVTYDQLSSDIDSLASVLRGKINGVAGVERSGMIPAYMLGLALNLPVVSYSEFLHTRFRHASKGNRPCDCRPTGGTVAVIDDSLNSGSQMIECQSEWRQSVVVDWSPIYVAVYKDGRSPNSVHLHARAVNKPRFFEWNIWHHADLSSAMLDMDGILCHDPQVIDDDGEAYRQAIINAKPRHIPGVKFDSICTCRLERWRPETEEWLRANGVKYRNLIMGPWASAEERRRTASHGWWKGEKYSDSPCDLFIESSSIQAADIWRRVRQEKPVLDWERKRML